MFNTEVELVKELIITLPFLKTNTIIKIMWKLLWYFVWK